MADKKSNTKYLELPGKIKWARLFEFNRDMKGYKGAYEDCEGAYTAVAVFTDDVMEELRRSGSQKKGTKTEDGTEVKLIRKHLNEKFPSLGGPPQVAHADGTPWDAEVDGLIGNGSDVIFYISIYGEDIIGTRLNGVQVINHVEYESDYEGFKMPDRTADKPKKAAPSKPKAKKADAEEDMPNDVIPF